MQINSLPEVHLHSYEVLSPPALSAEFYNFSSIYFQIPSIHIGSRLCFILWMSVSALVREHILTGFLGLTYYAALFSLIFAFFNSIVDSVEIDRKRGKRERDVVVIKPLKAPLGNQDIPAMQL